MSVGGLEQRSMLVGEGKALSPKYKGNGAGKGVQMSGPNVSTSSATMPQNPGLMSNSNISQNESREISQVRTFLGECEHIHNKSIFDAINEAINMLRY